MTYPKPHWEIKEVNGHLKSLLSSQNQCLPCVPLLVHKWLHSAGGLLTAREQTLLGVCTYLLQHPVQDRPRIFKTTSFKI